MVAAASAGLLVAGLLGGTPALAATGTRVTSLSVPSEPVDLETTPGAVVRAHIVDPVGIVAGDSSTGEVEPFTGEQPYGNWEANRIHVARLDGTTADIDLRPLGFDTVFRTIGRFGTYFDQQSPSTTTNTTLVYGGTVTLRARLYWVEEASAVRHPIPGKLVTILHERIRTSRSSTATNGRWPPPRPERTGRSR